MKKEGIFQMRIDIDKRKMFHKYAKAKKTNATEILTTHINKLLKVK